jgi:hypothetical protein
MRSGFFEGSHASYPRGGLANTSWCNCAIMGNNWLDK